MEKDSRSGCTGSSRSSKFDDHNESSVQHQVKSFMAKSNEDNSPQRLKSRNKNVESFNKDFYKLSTIKMQESIGQERSILLELSEQPTQ